jgi:hypothetical protein
MKWQKTILLMACLSCRVSASISAVGAAPTSDVAKSKAVLEKRMMVDRLTIVMDLSRWRMHNGSVERYAVLDGSSQTSKILAFIYSTRQGKCGRGVYTNESDIQSVRIG